MQFDRSIPPSQRSYAHSGLSVEQPKTHDLQFMLYNLQMMQLSQDRRRVEATQEMVPCAAFGDAAISSGSWSWSVFIEVSRLSYGGAMTIGVSDADSEVTSTVGGPSWGFNPYSGSLLTTDNAYNVNYAAHGKALMHGDLQGKANGAVVTVTTMIVQLQAPSVTTS